MRKILSLMMLATVLFAGPALAADPIVGSWKLNVARSKFTSGQELKAGSRVYTEADGVYTLDQKVTGADGKEISYPVQYSDGKDMKQSMSGPTLASTASSGGAGTRPTPRRSMHRSNAPYRRAVPVCTAALCLNATYRGFPRVSCAEAREASCYSYKNKSAFQ